MGPRSALHRFRPGAGVTLLNLEVATCRPTGTCAGTFGLHRMTLNDVRHISLTAEPYENSLFNSADSSGRSVTQLHPCL